jgi:hypothetical protein
MRLFPLIILPLALVLTVMSPAGETHGADLQTATFYVA